MVRRLFRIFKSTFVLMNHLLRFVEAVLNSVIEKNGKARVLSGGLFAAMLSKGLLGEVILPRDRARAQKF